MPSNGVGNEETLTLLQSYRIQAVSKIDPMKHLYEAPSLVKKLAKWRILLT